MQSAEEEVQTYTSIARNAIGGQAFHFDATTYPSQAETTLNRYSTEHAKGTYDYNSDATNKSSTSLGQSNSCFGCSSPHPWMRNKVVLCPHKEQGPCRNPRNCLEELHGVACQVQGPPQETQRRIYYDCLSNANKEKITKQVLSSMANSSMKDAAASTITDDSNQQSNKSSPRPWTSNCLIFVVDVSVLSTATFSRQTSPTFDLSWGQIWITNLARRSVPSLILLPLSPRGTSILSWLSQRNFHTALPSCMCLMTTTQLFYRKLFRAVVSASPPNLLSVFSSTYLTQHILASQLAISLPCWGPMLRLI
jgi:hypothetical protein